jgi:glycosyltransferase involved in cell wall biosynthesis
MSDPAPRDVRPVVCHVTSVHVPTDSRILYHECRSLATRYRTVLVCRDDGGPRVIEGVEIAPLPRTRGRLARYLGAGELVRRAEATGADIFHFHDPELLSEMAELARRTGRPVVYDAHEYYPDAMTQKAWIPAPARPLAARWADQVEKRHAPAMAAIVTADAALTARFAELNGRVVELDNYPPLALFPAERETPPGPPTLVYVGSVSAVRGFFDMVEVLRRVRTDLPDARLLIYGRATEEVAPRLTEVIAGLPSGALALHGGIPYGSIGEALAQAHVGMSLLRAHPKYEKNVSMKVFDYMAAGLPYVASDFRPLREATGGVGGRLVAPGDPAAAAEAVLGLLRDSDEAGRTGREGRALVEERLNWERMEPRLFGLYEELLS